ncbi:hypothetical protein SprV_0902795100 [Sparganum proliferum]
MLVDGTLWGLSVINCSLRIPFATVEFVRMNSPLTADELVCCKSVRRFFSDIFNMETSVLTTFENPSRRRGKAAIRRLYFHGLEKHIRHGLACNTAIWKETAIHSSSSLAYAAFTDHVPVECLL